MKRILLLNGSPKGKAGNTARLTNAFLEGFNKKSEYEIDEVICSQVSVHGCKGCFGCWKNEDGKCVIDDDMSDIFQKYLSADIVIWSFPTYFYGMPSEAKKIMDRLLPLFEPELITDDGKTTYHPRRYERKNQKYILFCSCAYFNTEQNTEGIKKQFELLYGDKCEMLFCSESRLLSNKFMDYLTESYLKALKKEGERYSATYKLSEEIKEKFKEPFLPIDDFLKFVKTSAVRKQAGETKEEYDLARISAFFKNLSFTYDPKKLAAEKSVTEIELTDYPYICQLHMDKEKCELVEKKEDFLEYRLRIVSKLEFFTASLNLDGTGESNIKCPTINSFVDWINKFEKKNIRKEIKF